jgi:hypothetical protein
MRTSPRSRRDLGGISARYRRDIGEADEDLAGIQARGHAACPAQPATCRIWPDTLCIWPRALCVQAGDLQAHLVKVCGNAPVEVGLDMKRVEVTLTLTLTLALTLTLTLTLILALTGSRCAPAACARLARLGLHPAAGPHPSASASTRAGAPVRSEQGHGALHHPRG